MCLEQHEAETHGARRVLTQQLTQDSLLSTRADMIYTEDELSLFGA